MGEDISSGNSSNVGNVEPPQQSELPQPPAQQPAPFSSKSSFKEILQRPVVIGSIILVVLIAAVGAFFLLHNNKPKPATTSVQQVTLRYVGPGVGVNYDFDKTIIANFEKNTGIKVDYVAGPESVNDRIAMYQDPTKSKNNDVELIDVVWPGLLADNLVDLNPLLPGEAAKHYPAIITNNTIDGKLVGMPLYTDASLLYYRSDLLKKYGYTEPPTTWDEMTTMATKIQAGERKANADFWGYVWQGADYEGLTCNALEWQDSFGGGTIVDETGKVTVNNPQTIKAFTLAASWVGTISPKNSGSYQEEDSRSIWQSGNAAFMRNWPYAYSLGQASDSLIKDKFSVALLPTGGNQHVSALGGWQLSINKESSHQKEAAQFIAYMTSEAVQKQRAVDGSYMPTRTALEGDKDIVAKNPYYDKLSAIFKNNGAVSRPSSITKANYQKVSAAYSKSVNGIITGQETATVALPKLQAALEAIVKE